VAFRGQTPAEYEDLVHYYCHVVGFPRENVDRAADVRVLGAWDRDRARNLKNGEAYQPSTPFIR